MSKPARKITNQGNRKNIGYFASRHSGLVKFESHQERDTMFMLDSDGQIKTFRSQPETFKYVLDGKKRIYTPDILVHYVNKLRKPMFIEVKMYDKLQEDRRKFRAIKIMLNDKGFDFCVITEKTIQVQPRLDNIKLLHRYADIRISNTSYQHIKEYFSDKPHAVLGFFKEHMLALGVTVNEFYSAIFNGILIVDINQRINFEALVFFNFK